MNEPALLPPPKDPKTVRRVKAILKIELALAALKKKIKEGGDEDGHSTDQTRIHVG